nr:MFS transporter [Amycolatopsis taiwanensis]
MAVKHALVDVAPLRSSPAFRRLWIGRVFSGFGSQMTLVAVMYQVWQMTNSTVWTGAVGLAQAIPLLLFGLFAGAMIDRVDVRRSPCSESHRTRGSAWRSSCLPARQTPFRWFRAARSSSRIPRTCCAAGWRPPS